MKTREVNGIKYYITMIEDVEPNEGGYYCQVYKDEDLNEQINDFVIHAEWFETEEDIDNIIDDHFCDSFYQLGTGCVKIAICSNGVDVELYGDIWDCRDIAKLLNVEGNIYINDNLYN